MTEITKGCTVGFMKARNCLGKKNKTEDGENVLFKDLAKSFFVGMKKLFMVKLLSNALQFVKRILLEMVIGQHIKEEGYDQN